MYSLHCYCTYLIFHIQGSYSCAPNDNNVTCLLGNPLKDGKSAELTVRLNPSNIKATTTAFQLLLVVNTYVYTIANL